MIKIAIIIGRTLKPLSSREQIEAVHSGGLDAGFVFTISNINRELAQLRVAPLNLMLAIPKGHALKKLKKLRLRDLAMPLSFGFLHANAQSTTTG